MWTVSTILDWFRRKPPVSPSLPVTIDNLAKAINVERARFGLPPFVQNPTLMLLAYEWCYAMAMSETMTHGDFESRFKKAFPNTEGYEIIAEGEKTIEEVISLWMSSPPHRAGILGNFTDLGPAFAMDKAGVIFWCVVFARIKT